MPIDFYQLPGSAPCRAVALTAAVLGVELNVKELNLQAGEHLKPEFLKVRQQSDIFIQGRVTKIVALTGECNCILHFENSV